MRISPQGSSAFAALAVVLLMAATPAAGAPALLRRLRRHASDTGGEADADGYADANDYDANAAYAPSQQRQEKQLPYFSYFPQLPPGAIPPQFYDYSGYQDGDDNEVLSRAEPTSNRKPAGYPDSPVYYIRMPPTPYVFVPGLGYVSQPPAPPPAFSPFINVPVDFVANGKPTSVYWRPAARPPLPPPQAPAPAPSPGASGGQRPSRPQADSPVTQLDQGPYVFNGRPSDLFLLRNTYNSLYNDALQNIYP